MFMIIKRKHISVALVIIMCLTVGIVSRFKSGKSETKEVAIVSEDLSEESPDVGEALEVMSSDVDYITNARTNRDITRSKACELLKSTIDNPNSSQDAKKDAETQLIKMATEMDVETECENILQAKGFGECVVFISNSAVTVTILKKDIPVEDIAKINDIIFEQTGNNNVKIVEVK